MKFNKENIVAVVPEHCSGPGWTNQIIHVIYRDNNKQLQELWLQPEEWANNPKLVALFNVAAELNKSLKNNIIETN